MNKYLHWAGLVCAAALAGGCATSTAGTHVTVDTASGDAHILECSPRLATRLRVSRVTYGEADGLRRATVTLQSTTTRRQELQARMVWLDAEGSEIDADGKPFRALVLDGKDATTFTGISPRPDGVKARLVVRETRVAQ